MAEIGDKEFPSVLVVSNNSFSKSSSNGRTLGNLFIGWPKDKLAQFCISTTEPDYDVCDNYFLLTDRSMLDGFIHMRKGKRCRIETNLGSEGNTVIGGKKVLKTSWKALLRHLVWSGKRWNSKEFQEWIDEFGPELVVVMNSDAIFVLDIAYYISERRDIPLVMYNTEGYYFFAHNYFRQSKFLSNSAFCIYQFIYKHHFGRMMKRVVLSVHLNSTLAADYRKEFGGEHIVSYTGSTLAFDSSQIRVVKPVFTYLGNLGYNRPFALIDIANVLQELNPNYILDVYGMIPRQEIKEMFDKCPGIYYKGLISYEEVTKVMYGSTILFHAEVQTESFKEALRYGFSTKIADSISSGRPFLIYASREIAGAEYIKETGAGWQAENKEELRAAILSILYDQEERSRVLSVARSVSTENHDARRNALEFKNRLLSIYR